MEQTATFSLALLLILGIGSQWIAWHFRFPVIILLLFFGLLFGPVLSIINPKEIFGSKLNLLVNFGVAIILFEGGLNLKFREVNQVLGSFLSLLTLGVMISAVLITVLAHFLLDMSWGIAAILGALLVVSGPTVIIPMLRHLRIGYNLKSLLKWEGIVVDPLGAILTITIFDAVVSYKSQEIFSVVVPEMLKTISLGAGTGVLAAALIILLIRFNAIPDFLQELVTLGAVMACILLQCLTHRESALFAVTTMGVVLANQRYIEIKNILRFKENLRILLISFLFIVLAANIELDTSFIADPRALVFVVLLIVLVRPLSVFVSTLGSNLRFKEKLFIGFVAPRGIIAAAVSSYIAINLMTYNAPEANRLVQTVFLVIIVTVIFYGLFSLPLAQALGLTRPAASGILMVGINDISLPLAEVFHKEGIPMLLVDNNWYNVSKAKMIGLAAHHGNILADTIGDEIDFTDFQAILLMTSNREINVQGSNALKQVCQANAMFQIGIETEKTIKKSMATSACVSTLFGPDITYAYLKNLLTGGAKYKIAKITSGYTVEALKAQYAETASFIAIINPEKKVHFVKDQKKFSAQSGALVIYVPRRA